MNPAAFFFAVYVGLWGVVLVVLGIADALPVEWRAPVGGVVTGVVILATVLMIAWAVAKAPG